jgi:hypothetical protein
MGVGRSSRIFPSDLDGWRCHAIAGWTVIGSGEPMCLRYRARILFLLLISQSPLPCLGTHIAIS